MVAARRWSGAVPGVAGVACSCSASGSSRSASPAHPEWVPPSTFLLLVVVAVFLLRLRNLVVLGVVVLGCAWCLWWWGAPTVIPGVLVVTLGGGAGQIAFARDRATARPAGSAGRPHAGRPAGPARRARARPPAARRVAGGQRDPLRARRRLLRGLHGGGHPVRRGTALEIVLVDVSGKGLDAGVRSLQLSGAFGGLLGALPAGRVPVRRQRLPARPGVGRGLRDGDPRGARPVDRRLLGVVGGPPARGAAACGLRTLELLDTVGSPALGVVADIRCESRAGRLERGDVLLLYTDGLVEVPRGRPGPGHRPAHGGGGPRAEPRSRLRGGGARRGAGRRRRRPGGRPGRTAD